MQAAPTVKIENQLGVPHAQGRVLYLLSRSEGVRTKHSSNPVPLHVRLPGWFASELLEAARRQSSRTRLPTRLSDATYPLRMLKPDQLHRLVVPYVSAELTFTDGCVPKVAVTNPDGSEGLVPVDAPCVSWTMADTTPPGCITAMVMRRQRALSTLPTSGTFGFRQFTLWLELRSVADPTRAPEYGRTAPFLVAAKEPADGSCPRDLRKAVKGYHGPGGAVQRLQVQHRILQAVGAPPDLTHAAAGMLELCQQLQARGDDAAKGSDAAPLPKPQRVRRPKPRPLNRQRRRRRPPADKRVVFDMAHDGNSHSTARDDDDDDGDGGDGGMYVAPTGAGTGTGTGAGAGAGAGPSVDTAAGHSDPDSRPPAATPLAGASMSPAAPPCVVSRHVPTRPRRSVANYDAGGVGAASVDAPVTPPRAKRQCGPTAGGSGGASAAVTRSPGSSSIGSVLQYMHSPPRAAVRSNSVPLSGAPVGNSATESPMGLRRCATVMPAGTQGVEQADGFPLLRASSTVRDVTYGLVALRASDSDLTAHMAHHEHRELRPHQVAINPTLARAESTPPRRVAATSGACVPVPPHRSYAAEDVLAGDGGGDDDNTGTGTVIFGRSDTIDSAQRSLLRKCRSVSLVSGLEEHGLQVTEEDPALTPCGSE